MPACNPSPTAPALVAPMRPAVGLMLAMALAAPGLSLAAPFLPNPAYLFASTQTDGIRFAPNPDEAPVDSKRTTIEGADLVSQPVLTQRSDTVLSNGAQAHAQIEASMGVLRGKLSTHYEKTFNTDDGWVDAVFSTSFEDFIEVTAPGLAAGTPITYTFSLTIDGTSDAWADHMSTARFNLTPNVAGANTVSVSGHDHAVSVVPEPTTAILFVMGMLYALAAWRGRLPHLD